MRTLLLAPAEEVDRLRNRFGTRGNEFTWRRPDETVDPAGFEAVILAAPPAGEDELLEFLFAAGQVGARVWIPSEAAPRFEWIVTRPLDDRPFVEARPRATPLLGASAKRFFETALVILSLPIVLPLLGILAYLLRRESPGPAFLRQERVGRHGRVFGMWKLRTMPEETERDTGPVLPRADDPRATPFGRRLRSLGLDELPQLFHVLDGSMSLVGPRPERAHFLGLHSSYAGRRLLVRPGLTGLAQISLSAEAAPEEKFRFDEWYLRRRTLGLDLRIIARTAGKFLRRLRRTEEVRDLHGTWAPHELR